MKNQGRAKFRVATKIEFLILHRKNSTRFVHSVIGYGTFERHDTRIRCGYCEKILIYNSFLEFPYFRTLVSVVNTSIGNKNRSTGPRSR